MADEFYKKFGFEKPTEMYGGENAAFEAAPNLDPTRDKLFSYLEEYLPNQAGNIVGGEGRGFMDMGYIDIPVIGDAMDVYDAGARLVDAYKTDNYTARDDAMIGRLPFASQLALMLTKDTDAVRPIVGDYYDNKAEPMTYLTGMAAAGPIIVGLGGAAMKFLKRQFNKLDNVMEPSSMDLQMDAARDSLMARRPTGDQGDPVGALGQFDGKTSTETLTPEKRRIEELVYGEFDPPMTAAERARLMEMQNPVGDYDEQSQLSLPDERK